MREHAVDGVGHRRVDRVTGLVARAEHEVVDEQLGAPVEQLAERLSPSSVSKRYSFSTAPRAARVAAAQLVAESRVVLLAGKELLTCSEPFLAGSNLVISMLSSSFPATIGCSKRDNEQPLVAYSEGGDGGS